jgi:hypothetical protein
VARSMSYERAKSCIHYKIILQGVSATNSLEGSPNADYHLAAKAWNRSVSIKVRTLR